MKNWDKVKAKNCPNCGATSKEKFNAIKETITGAFTKAKEAVTNKVKEIGNTMKKQHHRTSCIEVFNGVKDTVHNVMSAATETARKTGEHENRL